MSDAREIAPEMAAHIREAVAWADRNAVVVERLVPKLYHGGPRGLSVILPPTETKVRDTSAYVPGNGVHSRSKVYLTSSFDAAIMYASCHPKGVVYEVRPQGQLEADPDCSMPGLSWACDRAEVVRRHRIPGKTLRKARAALQEG